MDAARSKCERLEKELQRSMEQHDGLKEDRELVLSMLMDLWEHHPHSLYSAGLNPDVIRDLDTMLEQVSIVKSRAYCTTCSFAH